MDFLQIALIFLIFLISIFLTITGFQVFFILRDLHKALKRLNKVLDTGEQIVEEVEKPVAAAAKMINNIGLGAKKIASVVKRKPKVLKSRRFYKKTL